MALQIRFIDNKKNIKSPAKSFKYLGTLLCFAIVCWESQPCCQGIFRFTFVSSCDWEDRLSVFLLDYILSSPLHHSRLHTTYIPLIKTPQPTWMKEHQLTDFIRPMKKYREHLTEARESDKWELDSMRRDGGSSVIWRNARNFTGKRKEWSSGDNTIQYKTCFNLFLTYFCDALC